MNIDRHPATRSRVKRVLDFAAGSLLLLLASPLLIGLGLAVRVSMGSPVMFRQRRVGLDRQEFELIKFRTMRPPRADESMLLTDAVRVTRIGRFLRRTSLDELPTLVNVVRGEMSLVGPRPLLPMHYLLMSERQSERARVKPGITGFAQVSGRQQLTFSQRVALDLDYLDTWSHMTDLRILARTGYVALVGTGIKTGQAFKEVDDIGLERLIIHNSDQCVTSGDATATPSSVAGEVLHGDHADAPKQH